MNNVFKMAFRRDNSAVLSSCLMLAVLMADAVNSSLPYAAAWRRSRNS